MQRTHALEPQLPKALGHFDRTFFVRARAVDDDLAFVDQFAESVERVDIDCTRTWNPSGRLLRHRRAYVEDGAHPLLVDQLPQLVHGDPIHAQLPPEQKALPPFG